MGGGEQMVKWVVLAGQLSYDYRNPYSLRATRFCLTISSVPRADRTRNEPRPGCAQFAGELRNPKIRAAYATNGQARARD